MVFQNMGLKRMNEVLYQKDSEEKGMADRAKLFKGRAQCLSSDEFYNVVRELDEGRKSKAADKEAKKLEREHKKVLQAELNKEWAKMKEQHGKAVEAWSAECSKLVVKGVQKKDPPSPSWAKSPSHQLLRTMNQMRRKRKVMHDITDSSAPNCDVSVLQRVLFILQH
jgi:hypothetical protein